MRASAVAPNVGLTSLPLRHGFPNVTLARRALNTLIPAIKRGRLPTPPSAQWTGHEEFDCTRPIIAVQALARRIAAVYGLQVGTIVVTFIESMTAAGRVELGGSSQRDFFIEIRREYQSRPGVLLAVLAHEVAHIFLQKHGVHLEPGLAEEILTDTTALVYGFGAVMADTYEVSEETTLVGNVWQTVRSERNIGYLTPEERGYVLFRAGMGALVRSIGSAAAKSAVREGGSLAERELSCPPLRLASGWRRLWYRLLRWNSERSNQRGALGPTEVYALEPGKVAFHCVSCCQSLRVPTRKQILVTCPRCRCEMPCET